MDVFRLYQCRPATIGRLFKASHPFDQRPSTCPTPCPLHRQWPPRGRGGPLSPSCDGGHVLHSAENRRPMKLTPQRKRGRERERRLFRVLGEKQYAVRVKGVSKKKLVWRDHPKSRKGCPTVFGSCSYTQLHNMQTCHALSIPLLHTSEGHLSSLPFFVMCFAVQWSIGRSN